MMESIIHETAIVDPKAVLGQGVSVGPYAVIEGPVTIGDHVAIGSHCFITGNTTIGRGCQLMTGAVIGSPPQDKKHQPSDVTYLQIGANNVFREYVTINRGTIDGGGITRIGDGNLFMAYSHVAHDCHIGNEVTMANSVGLAGHTTIDDKAIIGGLCGVHQFVRVGRLAIVGGCSKVTQDIPPFSMSDGNPARVIGLNSVGLKRANFSPDTTSLLRKAFKIIFHSGLSRSHAIENVQQELGQSPELDYLINFIKESKRGICG